MTDDHADESKLGVDGAAAAAATEAEASQQADQDGVAELMADAPEGRDLEAQALRAAEQAIAKAELALASAELAGAAKEAQRAEQQLAVPASRQRLIQAVLILNVLLMGLMLALPNPPSGTHAPSTPAHDASGAADPEHGAAAHGGEAAGHDAGHGEGRESGHSAMDQRGGVSGAAWIRALQYSGAGDYERAAQTLEGHLAEHPDLPAFERKTYYTALMHYLAEAGRDEEVEAYQGKLMALGNQRYLPADILRMARSAEDSGDGARMRQLYARFLLTQGRHTAAERRAVAEAYLKLGDSYRVQAQRGEQRASVMQRLREARLRSETRERRNAARQAGGQE